jgi:hypothetical protein
MAWWAWLFVFWLGVTAGSAVLFAAFARAATRAQTSLPGN